MSDSPNLALPFLAAGQAQKHVTINEALLALDALVQLMVLDRDRTTPPASPADGVRYIVAAGASGAWAGHDAAIAAWQDGAWTFYAPKTGMLAFVADEGMLYVFSGAAWTSLTGLTSALQNLALLGVGTTADATNPFSAKLNKALWAAKSAAEGGSGDLRYTLNKEAAANVLSLLMQSNWSGRAEIGLIGDDDLSFKVSSDGSTWFTGLVISRSTGRVSFPSDNRLSAGRFYKADPSSVAFTRTGNGTISLKAGSVIERSGILYPFSANTAVQMPALTAGTDYAIYLCNDGTLRADASFSAPAGFTTTTSRKIGGFHYAPGGTAAAQAGGNTTPQINPYSIWDIKCRPACPDPRGMALVADTFWCDIYMLGVNHHTNGTSRNNATIADGASPPKVPAMFGGDGSATYSSLTWFEATEVLKAYGKSLLDYAEFSAAAYGVTEAVSRGNDPVTAGLGTTNSGASNTDEKFTSKWGIIQASGVQYAWGRDFSYIAGTGSAGWKDNAGGRGQLYLMNDNGLVVPRFGGSWADTVDSGSRASVWNTPPWSALSGIGARGRADHLVQI